VRATALAEVISLYERHGEQHYDEEISQLAHALQTAALAEASGALPGLVVASLLHDLGHLLEIDQPRPGTRTEDRRHEALGAVYLASLFPPQVTAAIALHVRAKRYLCAVDTGYVDGLSGGSVRSLELQGGPMDPGEIEAFENLPGFADAVALRRWDDTAKVTDLEVAPFEHYEKLLDESTADFAPSAGGTSTRS
jgi:phosphonate degradation associated HDIG domain protein